MQLFPQQNFTVVRQIPDHNDLGTYYVQAVVRNAHTDELLATLNLEDKGSLRFKKDWRVSADPSGMGYYVSIITSVYIDSGYTTKAEPYGDDENTYLVLARQNGMRGGYNGPTLKEIRDAVKQEVKVVHPKNIKFPAQQKINIPKYEMKWDKVLEAIAGLKPLIEKIPTNETDLSPITEQLNTLSEAISAIPTEATDLTPVIDQLDAVKEQSKKSNEKLYKFLTSEFKSLPKKLGEVFRKVISELNFVTSSVTFVGDGKPMMHQVALGEKKIEKKEPESKGFDIKKLSGDDQI